MLSLARIIVTSEGDPIMQTLRGAVATTMLLALMLLALTLPASAQTPPRVLRIAMTATDVPTTTGMPNNGFEGMRFLGYPVFEALALWDLSRADQPAALRPG